MVRKLSYNKRQRIVTLYIKNNLHFMKCRFRILKRLVSKEDILTSEKTLRRIVKHWQRTGSVADKPSLTRAEKIFKITHNELAELDRLIESNKETTALQAKNALNLRASTRTVQRYLRRLGWRRIVTRFCQFVSSKNRIERIIFCNFCRLTREDFEYSIFIDECTVKMDKNGRFQWYKKRKNQTKSGLVAKYKHTASIHVIGGISRRGRTKLIIFSGNTNTAGFKEVASQFISPFVAEKYSTYHRLHLDNASFHTNSSQWLAQNGLNHFKTPAQSPDLNPIELVWNDLKFYIGKYVKPTTMQDLINGIITFWNEKVTIDYCNRKIDHLYKVIDTIFLLDGRASGL